MELSGQVKHILPSKTGTSAKGDWIQHAFVIETPGQYPKNVMFSMFSKDPHSQLAFKEYDNVTVSFSVESREWNGKWYSDIKAFKVTTEGQRTQQDRPTKGAAASSDDDLFGETKPRQQQQNQDVNTDDLPFG